MLKYVSINALAVLTVTGKKYPQPSFKTESATSVAAYGVVTEQTVCAISHSDYSSMFC